MTGRWYKRVYFTNCIHILNKVGGGGNRRESEEVKLQISRPKFCGNYRKIRVENVHRSQ